MIESITAGYALVFIVIILIIQGYVEVAVRNIFKEIKVEKKPRWFYSKVKYLYDHREKLPNHIQGKIDEVIVCITIMIGLFILVFFLYLVGNIYK